MVMENFEHKCNSCKKTYLMCDCTIPLFAEDRITPMQSIPGDTIIWCGEYEGAKNTEQQLQPDSTQ